MYYNYYYYYYYRDGCVGYQRGVSERSLIFDSQSIPCICHTGIPVPYVFDHAETALLGRDRHYEHPFPLFCLRGARAQGGMMPAGGRANRRTGPLHQGWLYTRVLALSVQMSAEWG
jgi:hypothetical protein